MSNKKILDSEDVLISEVLEQIEGWAIEETDLEQRRQETFNSSHAVQ